MAARSVSRKRRVSSRPVANGADGRSSGSLLKNHAYAELKRRILSGEFAPGTFLSERQLAPQLAMSKTPIRAAVERLEMEGFLTVSPQQGIVVRDLPVHEIVDQYEIRVALESYVMRTLAGRLSPEQIAQLEANLRAQQENLQHPHVGRGVDLDAAFHILFCEFLGNREILRVMSHLRDKMYRVIFRVFQLTAGRMATSYEEHRALAEAFIAGDGELAAQRIRDHLEYGKRCLLSPRHG